MITPPYPAAPALHFAAEVLGIMAGMALYQRLRRGTDDPISEIQRTYLLIAAIFGALLGSRLLGALESPEVFFSGGGSAGALYYFRAKTIVGGLLGGLWAVEGAKRWLGVHHRSGDLYVYPLILAMIMGRIGCFSMGVLEPTYGLPTDGWYGIDLGDGIARHATALYEIVFLLAWGTVLYGIPRRFQLRPGRLFMLLLSGYLLYRFGIGFLQPLIPVAGLGSIQWACLLGLAWYMYDEWAGPQVRGAD